MKKMFNMPQITGGGGERTLGFTLAEVLITLAIIGVVAALTIPSVIANTQQQEFKTGLKKAVSVLNSAITMNMALEGETPYDTGNLYGYLSRHMSIIKSNVVSPYEKRDEKGGSPSDFPNASFYTTDGMRFEFPDTHSGISKNFRLYEDNSTFLRAASNTVPESDDEGEIFIGEKIDEWLNCDNKKNSSSSCSYCGSKGLNSNDDGTANAPCLIVVDVNGDRKPFPQNAKCFDVTCASDNIRKYADPNGKKLTDTFPIMITDKQAIPYGVAAQKAMYEAQK